MKYFNFILIAICMNGWMYAQSHTSFHVDLEFSNELDLENLGEGRLLLFFGSRENPEPRFNTWPSPGGGNIVIAKNLLMNGERKVNLKLDDTWSTTVDNAFEIIHSNNYYVQALWDSNNKIAGPNVPGNKYSSSVYITPSDSIEIKLVIDKMIPQLNRIDHNLIRYVDFSSDTLSKWWDRPMVINASVLLPFKYDSSKSYPIRYNVAGYGGRYNRVERLILNDDFKNWWNSEDAPQVINVFLDGSGPFGDSYQLDSENSGPYGYALMHELIPHIEQMYRNDSSSEYRFVDGCSTGGWVSLALQMIYPDQFNGAFSYSPDAVDFENYQLINIYKDDNAFTNEFSISRPVMRSLNGEPMILMKDFVRYENVLGGSDTYLDSGGQFSAHTALYSPKGDGGMPKPLFDPKTGDINHEVAEHWTKYDLKKLAKDNWSDLGPQLQGKIYIWMGDMDHFFLNPASRQMAEFLKTTSNPTSDANIEFEAMKGHCSNFSHRKVLEQIQSRIEMLNNSK